MNSRFEKVRPGLTELNRTLVLAMAISSGIAVANLYYIQPLLAEIAKTFNVTQVSVGSAAMLTQIGYALGMLFLLPLADKREKKSLILTMLFCATGALALMALAFNFAVLTVAAFAVGFCSVVPQMLIPLAAQMADPKERGKIIGSIMSGLLIGILVSRTFSGLVGEHFGWRAVFVIGAFLMVGLAFFLSRILPVSPPVSDFKYKELFANIVSLIKANPVLREAAVNGAMVFAAFSAFWTTLVFLLQSPVYNLGADVAGLFGLVGITGALAAPWAGKSSDKRNPKFTVGIGMALIAVSFIWFYFFGYFIWGLVVGVVLLDVGTQTSQISNQTRVHSLGDEARNRINMIYMVSFFLGGSLGSIAGSWFYSLLGWQGVCLFGLLTQGVSLINQFAPRKKQISVS